jgi:hypothetical protein
MTEEGFDIDQIGTSALGKEVLNFLTDDIKWFRRQFEALRFAISVAIKFEIPIPDKPNLTTSHNVSSLDDENLTIKNLIKDLYPNVAPYRKAQVLADAGLKFIYEKIKEEEWTLDKFID